eukprot:UN21950
MICFTVSSLIYTIFSHVSSKLYIYVIHCCKLHVLTNFTFSCVFISYISFTCLIVNFQPPRHHNNESSSIPQRVKTSGSA